jgi:hypothetical protein
MIELDFVWNISSIQLRAFLFVTRVGSKESLNTLELQMFLPPSMVTLSIAATRIHRGLIDYASVGHTEQYDTTPSRSSQRSLLTVVDMVG